MRQNYLAVQRDILNDASQLLCCYIIDNPELPDEVRDAANDVQFALSELLCYQPTSVDGERTIRLIPALMKWPRGYPDMLDELVMDLGEEKISPVTVMLARRAAEYADNMLFSDDFRLEAVDCLRDLIESMKGQAEGDDDEIDDDSRNSRKDTITMALTTNSLSFGDNGDARQGDSAASATAKAIQSPGVTRQESLANQAKVAGPGTDTPTTAFLDGSSLGEAKQL